MGNPGGNSDGVTVSPDGTGVIAGGVFDGDIIVNSNNGTVGLINHLTGVETVIATGGARGDLVSPDTSNGTLLLSTTDTMYRLSCGPNCSIGSVGNVSEPATVGLMTLGLAGVFVQRRRRRRAAANPLQGACSSPRRGMSAPRREQVMAAARAANASASRSCAAVSAPSASAVNAPCSANQVSSAA